MANGIVGTLLILLKTRADVTGINKMEHSMDKTMRKAKGLKAIMRAGSLMSILSGTQSVGQALGNYLEFEKQLGAIHSRLFAITGDTTKAQKHFDAIRQLSLNLGQDLTSTADAFSIFFSGTARNLGEQGALEMFESWSKVGRVLHFTPYQMERVTYALREMSSKGAIYSQDLKMQLGTHVPDAVGIAEQAVKNLRINGVKDLETFQKKSKGNLSMIADFMKEFTKVAESRYGSQKALAMAIQQPDALAGLIKARAQNFGVSFSQAGGKDATVIILRAIYDAFKSIDLNALAQNLAKTIKTLAKLTAFLIRSIPILIKLLMVLVTGMLFNVLSNIGMNLLGRGMAGRSAGLFGNAFTSTDSVATFMGKGLMPTLSRFGIMLTTFFKLQFAKLIFRLIGIAGLINPITVIMASVVALVTLIKNWDNVLNWWKKTFGKSETMADAKARMTWLQKFAQTHPDVNVGTLRQMANQLGTKVGDDYITINVSDDKKFTFHGIPLETQEDITKAVTDADKTITKYKEKSLKQRAGLYNKLAKEARKFARNISGN